MAETPAEARQTGRDTRNLQRNDSQPAIAVCGEAESDSSPAGSLEGAQAGLTPTAGARQGRRLLLELERHLSRPADRRGEEGPRSDGTGRDGRTAEARDNSREEAAEAGRAEGQTLSSEWDRQWS